VIFIFTITLKVVKINKEASLGERYEYFAENDPERKILNNASDFKTGVLMDKIHRSSAGTISLQKPLSSANCSYNVSSWKYAILIFYEYII